MFTAHFSQAGLLTYGSSYRPRLPNKNISGYIAAFVPDYSGGPAPDSHGVPFLNSIGAPGFSCTNLSYFSFLCQAISLFSRRSGWIFIFTIFISCFRGNAHMPFPLFHGQRARSRCDGGTWEPTQFGTGSAIQDENSDREARGSQRIDVGSEAYIKRSKKNSVSRREIECSVRLEISSTFGKGRRFRKSAGSFKAYNTLSWDYRQ